MLLDALDAVAFGFSPGAAKVALNFLELGSIRSANLGLTGPSDAEEIVDEAVEQNARREERRAAQGRTRALRQAVRAALLMLANEPPAPEAGP